MITWLLDLDGVVNAIRTQKEINENITPAHLYPGKVWPEDAWETAHPYNTPAGHTYPFLFARPVIDFINRVHATGVVDIRYHTTWQHDAYAAGELLGLPDLEVAEAPEFGVWNHRASKGWWKQPAAVRAAALTPLIWTDDHITWDLSAEGRRELAAEGMHEVMCQAPDKRTGLLAANLATISRFILRHEGVEVA